MGRGALEAILRPDMDKLQLEAKKNMKNIELNLTIDETNVLMEALGQMPYLRVHLLIRKIQQQATQQLESQEGRGAAHMASS